MNRACEEDPYSRMVVQTIKTENHPTERLCTTKDLTSSLRTRTTSAQTDHKDTSVRFKPVDTSHDETTTKNHDRITTAGADEKRSTRVQAVSPSPTQEQEMQDHHEESSVGSDSTLRCRNTRSTSEIPTAEIEGQRIRREDSVGVVSIIAKSGLLRWYELQPVRRVNRAWRDALDGAKEDLQDWPLLVTYLNHVNRLHICGQCQQPVWHPQTQMPQCQCPMSQAELDWRLCLASTDPRCHKDYAGLSEYKQAVHLLKFHQRCVRNFVYNVKGDQDFSGTAGCVYFFCTRDAFLEELLEELRDYNPRAFYLLMRISLLLLSQECLQSHAHPSLRHMWLLSSLQGIVNQPVQTDPAFWVRFTEIIQDRILRMHPVAERDPNDMPPWSCDDDSAAIAAAAAAWEEETEDHLTEQMQHVGNSLYKTLLTRDEVGDLLLGPRLADSINVFTIPRARLLPRLHNVFPLEWQPSFGCTTTTYRPPSSCMFVLRRKQAKEKKERKRKRSAPIEPVPTVATARMA